MNVIDKLKFIGQFPDFVKWRKGPKCSVLRPKDRGKIFSFLFSGN